MTTPSRSTQAVHSPLLLPKYTRTRFKLSHAAEAMLRRSVPSDQNPPARAAVVELIRCPSTGPSHLAYRLPERGCLKRDDFIHDPGNDSYLCPGGNRLRGPNRSKDEFNLAAAAQNLRQDLSAAKLRHTQVRLETCVATTVCSRPFRPAHFDCTISKAIGRQLAPAELRHLPPGRWRASR